LRLDIGERHDSPATGTVLHCPHAHDRIVDLATFEGDSMLILLPYQNMAVGQTVEVFWQLAGEPSSEKLDERVTGPEDVGQTMSFVLSRQRLEAMTDRLVQLYYKVRFGDRQIESSRQDILVVYDTPPSEPALEALPIKVVHPDTGNFVLTFELYEEPNWRTSWCCMPQAPNNPGLSGCECARSISTTAPSPSTSPNLSCGPISTDTSRCNINSRALANA
jgi:hypothetical protein